MVKFIEGLTWVGAIAAVAVIAGISETMLQRWLKKYDAAVEWQDVSEQITVI